MIALVEIASVVEVPPAISNGTLLALLVSAIGVMAGGFAFLARVALRMFLGPNLDGKGGAWGALLSRIDGMSEKIDHALDRLPTGKDKA